jgi:GTP-binding protein
MLCYKKQNMKLASPPNGRGIQTASNKLSIMESNLPQVVIIGRANVGKSTLFNKIIEKKKALVSPISGTTRDRNIAVAEWRGRQFQLTDTGGLDIDLNEETHQDFAKGIIKQAEQAAKTADLVLFVIDALTGATPADRELFKKIKKHLDTDKLLFVANKAESARNNKYDNSIFKLGLGEPLFISASSGSGVGDLLDEVLEKIPKNKTAKGAENAFPTIKVAFLGRPNVGKSSLLNSILGEERVIVSPVAHTTRESHDTEFFYKDHRFVVIDTAGMRKKAKVPKGLEKKSVEKSLQAINDCDIAVLVTEADKTVDSQDKKITQAILESGKSMIIAANKWDLIEEKETNTINSYTDYYRLEFPYLWWAPLIFTSAKEDLRSRKILDMAIEIMKSRNITIANSNLDKFLKSKIKQHRPSRGKGLKNPYIYEIEQEKTNPPRFIIYVNDPTILHFSYIRFLQNNLRDQFKIIGTPIQVEVRRWAEKTPEKKQAYKAKTKNKKKKKK